MFWIYVRSLIQLHYLLMMRYLPLMMREREFFLTIQSKWDEANVDLSHWWHLIYPVLRALSKFRTFKICPFVVSASAYDKHLHYYETSRLSKKNGWYDFIEIFGSEHLDSVIEQHNSKWYTIFISNPVHLSISTLYILKKSSFWLKLTIISWN